MRVILAEKPMVAKDIAKALGGFSKSSTNRYLANSKDCIITWAIGHLIELQHPSSKDINALPILPKEEDWQLKVINNDGYQEQFDAIKELFERNDVTEVVNACDAGREGELIGRLIYQKSGSTKPLKRMWINSMTKDGLTTAYKKIVDADKYEGLNQAARCRSKSDWVVGINGSIAATAVMGRMQNLTQVTAVGRVKTPVLTLVVHKQREIDNFVPEMSYGITANFAVGAEKFAGKWINYEAMLKKRNSGTAPDESNIDADDAIDGDKNDKLGSFKDKASANAVLKKCMNGSSPKPVSKVIETKTLRKSNAPNLFDLTTLQYEANKKFKISSKKTLEIVQVLYEKHKSVTYPRTDSTHLPSDYPNEVAKTFDKLMDHQKDQSILYLAQEAKDRIGEVGKHVFDDKKISDHFAIIPTGKPLDPNADKIVVDVYKLIVERFKAAFLPAMEYNETERFTFIEDEAFRSVGNTVINEGWTALFKTESGEKKGKKDVLLPAYEKESDIDVESIKVTESKSTPPKPFTNGTLIRAMQNISRYLNNSDDKDILKERGIGTPATRANIIDELLSTQASNGRAKQAMMEESGKAKYIVPTEYGKQVIAFLESHNVESLTQAEFTADWERKLEAVNKDANKANDFMDQTYEIVTGFIDAFKQAYQEIPISKLNGCVCPECSSELNIEPKLVGCSNSNCQFKITRIVASKSLGEADLSVLINEKETGVISGFIKRGTDKKSDKLFNAALKLNKKEDGTYEIQFHFPVVKFDLPCPICSGEMESNSSAIKCKVESCGMTIWRSINKNPIPESEIRLLIENGVTNAIDGFVSSKGTIFTGKLIINKDEKRVSFNFDGINSTSKEATTEKCFKACGGTYDLVGFKYICNSCEHWIPVKPKNAVKAFTKNQLASLAKGKFVAQKVKILNDEDKEVEVKKEFFIDPDSGRLFSRNFIEPKKA